LVLENVSNTESMRKLRTETKILSFYMWQDYLRNLKRDLLQNSKQHLKYILRQKLLHPKDKTPRHKLSGVVYAVQKGVPQPLYRGS